MTYKKMALKIHMANSQIKGEGSTRRFKGTVGDAVDKKTWGTLWKTKI